MSEKSRTSGRHGHRHKEEHRDPEGTRVEMQGKEHRRGIMEEKGRRQRDNASFKSIKLNQHVTSVTLHV